jgi:hypothetical protein
MQAALEAILALLTDGVYTFAEAVAALLELGIEVAPTITTVIGLRAFINSLISGGTHVSTSAVAPVPTLTPQAQGVGTCSTKSGNRGICCAAVTQLGLARAAQGFQYTNCNGKVVCLACGTKASTSKKNPGATVFSVRRVTCGPSGCPALGAAGGTLVAPV